MIHRHIPIEQIAPWFVSGASGCYVVARARRLSRAKASQATWLRFLAEQSDILVVLCGGPAVWHFARRRIAMRHATCATEGDRSSLAAGVTHQLRQVFTVLLLGLGMITRKATEGKTADLVVLTQRLQQITRAGAQLLSILDKPAALDLVDVGDDSHNAYLSHNGMQS
jgi:hypothetical protein